MSRIGSILFALLMLVAVLGCHSYRYMRDTTPNLVQMRQEYVKNHPGNRFNEDIGMGRIRSGMSRLQVRVTWGAPDEVLDGRRAGIEEVWTYSEEEPSRGESVYELHFAGELLKKVEILRGGVQLSTTETPRQRPIESEILTDDATGKP